MSVESSAFFSRREAAHGVLCAAEQWPLPALVSECSKPARADQGNTRPSHEFCDSDAVLRAKVKVVADLMTKAKKCVAYCGAGLSTASGIADYATNPEHTISTATTRVNNPYDAKPTRAHGVLAALHRAGFVAECVQQNHDGLPQKAGFPQEAVNEIHGSWYDPSNPVVQFNGSLRSDLFHWLCETESTFDMCLCLGTSLSHMNADRVPTTIANKYKRNIGLGTVIINLQQTLLDEVSTVRIWGKLDDVFVLLAEELHLGDVSPVRPVAPEGEVFHVPYNARGKRDESVRMQLDLREDAELEVVHKGAINFGKIGKVVGRTPEGDIMISFNTLRPLVLGSWWTICATAGSIKQLPVVNVGAVVWNKGDASPEIPKPVDPAEGEILEVIQSHRVADDGEHEWRLALSKRSCRAVRQVLWKLPPWCGGADQVKSFDAPFVLEFRTKGELAFAVGADVILKTPWSGCTLSVSHQVAYDIGDDRAELLLRALVVPASYVSALLVCARSATLLYVVVWQVGRAFAALPAAVDALLGLAAACLSSAVLVGGLRYALPAVALAAVDVAMVAASVVFALRYVVPMAVEPSGRVSPTLKELHDITDDWAALCSLGILAQAAPLLCAAGAVALRRANRRKSRYSIPLLSVEQKARVGSPLAPLIAAGKQPGAKTRVARRVLVGLCVAAVVAIWVPVAVSLGLATAGRGAPATGPCEGLCPTCILPFPSSRWVRDGRVSIPRTALRGLRDGERVRTAAINELDGFAVTGPVLFELDAKNVAFDLSGSRSTLPHLRAGKDFAPNCTALLDSETGELVPHWAEIDKEADNLIVIQPAVPLKHGRSYVVAVRGLIDMDTGAVANATRGWTDMMRNTSSPRWQYTEAHVLPVIRSTLKWNISSLQLAWDFPTVSEDMSLGRLRLMRQRLASEKLSYEVLRVENHRCPPGSTSIGRVVWAKARVPSFLSGRRGQLISRPNASAVESRGVLEPEFSVSVPCSLINNPKPALVLQYGHRLLSDCSVPESVQRLASIGGYVVVSSDWMGLTRFDRIRVAKLLLNEPSPIYVIAENVMQSYINADAVLTLVTTTMTKDPLLTFGGQSVIDPQRVAFYGMSQGAVVGGGYYGYSDKLSRAVLSVPGASFSLILWRSVEFARCERLLMTQYITRKDMRIGIAMEQVMLEPAEAAGWLDVVRTKAKPVLMHSAIGDASVPEQACHLMARGYSARTLHNQTRPLFGIPEEAAPYEGSVLVEWQYDDVPPTPADGIVTSDVDPHAEEEATMQARTFLDTGEVLQFCPMNSNTKTASSKIMNSIKIWVPATVGCVALVAAIAGTVVFVHRRRSYNGMYERLMMNA
eukprot:m51a1_g10941 hypothetical protein (1339) ;mRNA; f:178994-185324